MKLTHYIAGLLLISSVSLKAQDSYASIMKTKPDTGKHFDHKMTDGFVGLGFVLGPQQTGSTVKLGSSREFIVGFGMGYKFCKYDGLGLDIYYKSTDFYLKQDSTKVLPTNAQHQSEKIAFNNFGGLVFDRIYMGSVFLDAGFYLDWAFDTKDVTWDNSNNVGNPNSTTTKTINSPLSFTNSTNYGLTFRFGKQRGVSLYFSYRLSKVFNPNYNSNQSAPNTSGAQVLTPYPELPPYVLGIVLGNH
ncbi:MAG TPA: hypothetical protein VK806_03845 [Bacteroidia bacterium]|jgi:hypothetical protein|nr:hypothetical protein [Bacteroidia bacterium]